MLVYFKSMCRMMLAFVVVHVLITLGCAQTFPTTLTVPSGIILSNDLRCDQSQFQTDPWQRRNFDQYKAGFQAPMGVCYLSSFITPCATLTGAAGCNKYNQVCKSINSSIDTESALLHPEITTSMSQRPQICVSMGSFFHPDAIVFVIVLIIIGWLMLIPLLVYILTVFHSCRLGVFLHVLVIVGFILGTLLLFSYYYLNAVLVIGCMYMSYMLFSTRRSDCTAFGFLILIGGMLWTMHASALGWVQHMSRMQSQTTNTSVTMCINYYRGYFAYPVSLRSDFDNPERSGQQFCRIEWLAAELFFMILLQLVLLLAVVAGAAARNAKIHIPSSKPYDITESSTQEAD